MAAADGTVLANYGGFQEAADGFAAALGRFEGTVTDLDSQVTRLTAGNTGKYANQMRVEMAQIKAGLAEMQGVITNIKNFIPAAMEAYQTADQAAANLFS
jgi:WXG100 family type VII secretion target